MTVLSHRTTASHKTTVEKKSNRRNKQGTNRKHKYSALRVSTQLRHFLCARTQQKKEHGGLGRYLENTSDGLEVHCN